MSQVYFASDLHFGHKNIMTHEWLYRGQFQSIEEHNDAIVKRWNDLVSYQDVVYLLGDVIFAKPDTMDHAVASFNKLKGTIHLVMGNHDTLAMNIYANRCNRIGGAMEYKNCVLTHVPVHPDQLNRYRANIHGHLHSGAIRKDGTTWFPYHDVTITNKRPAPLPENQYDRRYCNVSLEHWGLAPVGWAHLQQLLPERDTKSSNDIRQGNSDLY